MWKRGCDSRWGNHAGACAGREQVPRHWGDAPSTNTDLTPGTANPREGAPGVPGQDDARSAVPNPRREMPRARSQPPRGMPYSVTRRHRGRMPRARPPPPAERCRRRGALPTTPGDAPAWPPSPAERCPSFLGRCPSPREMPQPARRGCPDSPSLLTVPSPDEATPRHPRSARGDRTGLTARRAGTAEAGRSGRAGAPGSGLARRSGAR